MDRYHTNGASHWIKSNCEYVGSLILFSRVDSPASWGAESEAGDIKLSRKESAFLVDLNFYP